MKFYKVALKIVEMEKQDFHTILNAKISGFPVRAVLDTGASHSCVDKNFVEQMLPRNSLEKNFGINAGISGSGFEVQITDIRDFRLGYFRQEILENIAVIDFKYINEAYKMANLKSVQFILGNDFLIEHKAIIDYTQNMLFFKK